MDNQLPVQPTPPSLLSIGKEPANARPRDIAEDTFRDELTDVITNVAAPAENRPARDSEKTSEKSSKDDSDHQIGETKNEKPIEEEQSSETPATDTESNEVKSSSSNEENPDDAIDTEVATDLNELVFSEIASSVETEVPIEEVAPVSIEAEEASQTNEIEISKLANTEEVIAQEGITLETSGADTESDSSSEADLIALDDSVTEENDSGNLEIPEEIVTEEVIVESDAEEISVAQATATTSQVANDSSVNKTSKSDQKASQEITAATAATGETTEGESSTDEGLNKPVQAASTQNFASELGTDTDGTIDIDTADDGAINEANNQNSLTERQAEKLTESRSARQIDTGAPRVDPTRFVSRVTKAFESAQQKGGPIEIRLSPPELGSLQVRLEVKEGILTASMETENQAARNAILDNLPALRERLAEQQIRIEKFDVDVRDDSNPSENWQQSDQQGDREAEADRDRHTPIPTGSEEADTSVATQSTPTIELPNNGINLVA